MRETERTTLENLLLDRVPDLAPFVKKAHVDWGEDGEDLSSYAVLTWAVRPFVESLLDSARENSLRTLFELLEELYEPGLHGLQNDISVMLEDLGTRRPEVWRFLGPKIAASEVGNMTWFPAHLNGHVDRQRYSARWAKEIESCGGLNKLTLKDKRRIRRQLTEEFRIRYET